MYYIKNDRIVSITKGFSFWAFVFVWGWLLSRGLWLQSFLVMLIYIPIYLFHSMVVALITSSLQLPELYYLVPTLILAAIHIYVGCNAKQWQKTALLRRGYKSIA